VEIYRIRGVLEPRAAELAVASLSQEQLEQLETVETEQGAHTTCWDPIAQCLYIFCPASRGAAVYEERA